MATNSSKLKKAGLARKRAGQNPIFGRGNDYVQISLDMLVDLIFYWEDKRADLRQNDYRNKVRLLGMIQEMKSAHAILSEVQADGGLPKLKPGPKRKSYSNGSSPYSSSHPPSRFRQ